MKSDNRQPELEKLFAKSFLTNRLGHAYLFEGARGTGKKELAKWIAQTIFCEQPESGQPCGVCRNCRRMMEGNLPDLIEIEPDGQSIKVNQIRELKTEFSKSAVEGSKKVYIIDQAEKMTVSAANSLLTFLEDPSQDTYLFLLTTVKENILPTIRSRCQIIHFHSLKREMMEKVLREEGIKEENLGILATLTNDLDEAKNLASDDLFQELQNKVWKWFQLLMKKDSMAILFVATDLMPLMKDKVQVVLCLDLLLFHYRDSMHIAFNRLDVIIHQTRLKSYQEMKQDINRITYQIEVILKAKQMLEANVQTQGVLESIAIQNQLVE